MTREDFIGGLRQLAAIYERNPVLEVPIMNNLWIFTYTAEDFVRNIAAFGNGAKKYEGEDIEFIADTILPVKVNCKREKICERKVVGVRHVPEVTRPAVLIPAHDEEIIEWDCRPVLAAAKARAAATSPLEIAGPAEIAVRIDDTEVLF
jgi:hypothetical protein